MLDNGGAHVMQFRILLNHMNEGDENRIAVLNRDTGEVSVWELTIRKEYDAKLIG